LSFGRKVFKDDLVASLLRSASGENYDAGLFTFSSPKLFEFQEMGSVSANVLEGTMLAVREHKTLEEVLKARKYNMREPSS